MRTRKALGALLAGALLVGGGAPARAEVCNCFCGLPTSFGSTEFIMTLKGDVRADINTTATANDPLVNPFRYYNVQTSNGATTTVTTALDGNGNTVVTFANSVAVPSGYDFHGQTGQPGGLPHIGLDGSLGASVMGGGAALSIIGQEWTDGAGGHSLALPSLSVAFLNLATPATADVDYLIVYANADPSAGTVGEWYEAPIDGSKAPAFSVTNYNANDTTLSNVGAYVSENFIPLDDLNYNGTPPPDAAGTPFTPLPSLDGTTLSGGDGIGGAGGTTGDITVPEPSSIIALGLGAAGLAIYRSRSRSRRGARA